MECRYSTSFNYIIVLSTHFCVLRKMQHVIKILQLLTDKPEEFLCLTFNINVIE